MTGFVSTNTNDAVENFNEGHSMDGTWEAIGRGIAAHPERREPLLLRRLRPIRGLRPHLRCRQAVARLRGHPHPVPRKDLRHHHLRPTFTLDSYTPHARVRLTPVEVRSKQP